MKLPKNSGKFLNEIWTYISNYRFLPPINKGILYGLEI
jgi:hypothetical protein